MVAELGWLSGEHTDRIIAIAVSGATVAILAWGKYKPVEVFSTIMWCFLPLRPCLPGSLQISPDMAAYKISMADIREGLKFKLPDDFSTASLRLGLLAWGP